VTGTALPLISTLQADVTKIKADDTKAKADFDKLVAALVAKNTVTQAELT
jgi:hypothetical protein